MIALLGGGDIGRPGHQYETFAIDSFLINAVPRPICRMIFVGWSQVPYGSDNEKDYFLSLKKTIETSFPHCSVECFFYCELQSGRSVQELRNADIIYFGGGDSQFLINAVFVYHVDEILTEMEQSGAIIAGLSAGAIMLAQNALSAVKYKTTGENTTDITHGIGLFHGYVLVPHFSTDIFRQIQSDIFLTEHPEHTILGIDDRCALIIDNYCCRTVSDVENARIHLRKISNGHINDTPLSLSSFVMTSSLCDD